MRPTRTILVNPLSAAREYLRTVSIAQMQCVSCGVMYFSRSGSVEVLSEVPQYELNEFVVCRNKQLNLRTATCFAVAWSIAPIRP